MELCLKATGLSKSFNTFLVLESWNLAIQKGERISIIGPSGCGKTTFLRMVAGLELPTQGSLHVSSRRAGYVFQEPRLIPWKTVKENIHFVSPQSDCLEILGKVGLAGFEEYFPEQLSGGMAQRVNLARALITEPDMLILDEAFFALDLEIKYQTMKVLMDLWKKRRFTMISVTHDLKDALFASDRILILSKRPSQIIDEYKVNRNGNAPFSGNDLLHMEAELLQIILKNNDLVNLSR